MHIAQFFFKPLKFKDLFFIVATVSLINKMLYNRIPKGKPMTAIFFYFTILYWFCHTSTWIRHGCTCVPHPESLSQLPPHTIPLGHPSAPATSILYHASNLDWWLISYMTLYIFECHSPKSTHPLPLTESKRLFYTSVSLLLSRIQGYCYHLFKLHIYALVYCIGVFLSGLLHSV